ncbi:flippase [Cytobacillus sp. FJAT-54145]|uniref:Flippase n=1 Tax=Cytobacillus spartinae TaxID=3299023 RepID=A0ABW6KBY3_9BACI
MSIAKNYIYNVIYQIVTLVIPIITIPYVSRVLGSSGVGTNAFTNSIVQYFILFGTIGISLYGNRTVAYVRDNKDELSRTFWGIFVLKIITTGSAFAAFLVFLFVVDSYQTIFLIQSIYILAAAVDISWLYMGLEDFKKTVIRNLFVRVIGVICIFLFVKTSTDLWIYVFILAFSQFLGHLSLWVYLPKTISRVKLKWIDIKKHLKPSISLFIPQIAIQIYLVLNKTMLGIFSNTNEVGYFDNADKVVKIVLSIVTAMGVVMLPRVANTFAKGQINRVKEYLYHSFDFASYLSIPLMFGLAGIALEFAPWFFGPEFSKSGLLICVISPIVLFIAWSNVIGQQYLMPIGNMRVYTYSVVMGAIINLILNFLLIGPYQSTGTAIATVIAEFCVIVVQLYFVRHEFKIKKLLRSLWKYLTAGFFMFLFIRYIGNSLGVGYKTTAVQVITGAPIYFILLFIMKSELNRKLFGVGLKLIRKVIRLSS